MIRWSWPLLLLMIRWSSPLLLLLLVIRVSTAGAELGMTGHHALLHRRVFQIQQPVLVLASVSHCLRVV